MQASQTTAQNEPRQGPAPWVAPVVVLVIIGGLAAAGSRKDEAVENPIVDLLILTVGVFAVAAVMRWAFLKLGSPGAANFFGAPPITTDEGVY